MQELASKYIPTFLKQAHSGSIPSLTCPETRPGLFFIPAVPTALVITIALQMPQKQYVRNVYRRLK